MVHASSIARLKKATPKKVIRKIGFEVNNYKTHLKCQKAKKKLLKTFDNPPAFAVTYDELGLITGSIVFLDNKEIPTLFRYGQSAKTLVEIGAAFGGSSSIFLAGMPKGGHLFSIDPFVEDSIGPWSATEEKCRQSVSRLLRVLNKEDALKNWSLLVKPSYDAVKKWQKKIDLIFIDGDHNYIAVKKDFADWLPHVKKGGLILIHDSRRISATPAKEYHRGWPGPTKLAKELRNDKRVHLIDESHSITVWKKR
ncbi:MAG: class I SAM-dependent methyltransferase [Candidatus Saccharimonadales bacterium]|jgi:predicted O-methyltransferase YrrM